MINIQEQILYAHRPWWAFWPLLGWILSLCPPNAHTKEVTGVILLGSSSQGCRFWSAYKEELCKHRGSGWMESLSDFWKASCCSWSISLFACCLSASLSSAVCLLEGSKFNFTSTWDNQAVHMNRRSGRPPTLITFPTMIIISTESAVSIGADYSWIK